MTDDYIADEYTIDLSPTSFMGTLTIKVVAETPDEAMEKTRKTLHMWTKEGLPPMCLNMKDVIFCTKSNNIRPLTKMTSS